MREMAIYLGKLIVLVALPIYGFNVFVRDVTNEKSVRGFSSLSFIVGQAPSTFLLFKEERFYTETDLNAAMVLANKANAKPRRYSSPIWQVRIDVYSSDIANYCILSQILSDAPRYFIGKRFFPLFSVSELLGAA